MGFKTTLAGVALFGGLVLGDSTFSPARPPAIPLAVKGPYLNTWLTAGSNGGNGGYLAGEWATFWQGQVTAWTGLIRVDGTPYQWMGAVQDVTNVDQTEFSYTSTQSTFILNAGGLVELNVTFLSPVTPTDLKRQSLPFSYLDVGVTSLDGANHDVQLYTDISGEWGAGDTSQTIEWEYDTVDGLAYHKYHLQTQTQLSETNQQPNWGDVLYATADGDGLTYQNGADTDVRGTFISDGVLPNTQDTDYRAVNDAWPVFGFAHDLGSVGTSSVNTLFTIGLAQTVTNSLLGEGSDIQNYDAYWTDFFASDIDALSFFFSDYSTAVGLATEIDNKVQSDSVAVAGQDYATITTLSLRQAFGALQLSGTEDDPILFLKEISSNGDMQTVDVIFPTIPVLIYTNPELLALILEPLFLNQENGHYPKTNAIHDLGTYPNAPGYPDGNDEPQPLEECGNMIIMALAYAQRTGNNDYLSQHYAILDQWAGYLVDEALIPADQISTDDFAGSLANQTDLAIKGIIGLRAMADIADITGNSDNATYYLNVSQSYLAQWQDLGINQAADPAHTTLNYNNVSSWGLLYNLYADTLLGYAGNDYAFVPKEIYDMQSDFYPTVALEYCVPLDTRHTYSKTDWSMWAASIAGEDTATMMVDKLANWISATNSDRAFSDWIDCITGEDQGFRARPVVGGHFAFLALNP
ncbi:glutaminase GtaA [Xylariaceae sp. FL1272]|nr:glutaminase GtaA [Xylariaceae sp. FL1272]